MALARSSSGPPALSINIGSANSLFGSSTTNNQQQQQPAASGGLFGQSTMSQPGGLFGSAKPAATGGGLFGATTTQPASGGLFGSAQPAAGGGLFGSAAPAAAKPGGLFGAATTSTQPQQSGGLFGNTAQTQQPASTGLFGATMGQQQPQQQAGGGLFGNANAQPKPSLFGATTAQQPQPQQQGGLFGGAPQQQSNAFGTTLGGGLRMGQQQAQNQTTVPAVRVDPSNIRITTRYNDIHEQIQKEIEQQDEMILGVIKQANECAAILPAHGDQLELIPDNVEFLQRKIIGVQSNQDADVQIVSQIAKQVEVDKANAKLSFDAIENLRLPQQYHQGMWNAAKQASASASKPGEPAGDIVNLFNQSSDEMNQTYRNNMDKIQEIEQHLRSLEISMMRAGANIGARNQGDDTHLVGEALKDFGSGLIQVASQVGAARENVQKLQRGPFIDPWSTNDYGKRGGVY